MNNQKKTEKRKAHGPKKGLDIMAPCECISLHKYVTPSWSYIHKAFTTIYKNVVIEKFRFYCCWAGWKKIGSRKFTIPSHKPKSLCMVSPWANTNLLTFVQRQNSALSLPNHITITHNYDSIWPWKFEQCFIRFPTLLTNPSVYSYQRRI